jgi:hypothetical protein
MQLGAITPKQTPLGQIAANDLDFSPFETRIKAIETKQNYLLIGIALLLLLTLLKNK